ncbi:hypothetical protein RRG08_044362 [Elysia crispata]|uniref:Uncharacterized protein n=1 Tax=Elysia crispata TaxID=231223 RepID=A0AAE1AAZ5_9GAST|nr:hypothetical protein RRG08_044362 [Elysia crispata]
MCCPTPRPSNPSKQTKPQSDVTPFFFAIIITAFNIGSKRMGTTRLPRNEEDTRDFMSLMQSEATLEVQRLVLSKTR